MTMQVTGPNCSFYDMHSTETSHHLFVECPWVKEVKEELMLWTNVQVHSGELRHMLQDIGRPHWNCFQKEAIAAICSATMYHTRRARNYKIFQ